MSLGYKLILVFLTILITCSTSKAQVIVSDTSNIPVVETGKFTPNPRRAALLAAAFPGLGQAYNRKYWKIPIVYIGAGAFVYFFEFNQKRYISYRDAYIARTDNNDLTVDRYVGLIQNESTLRRATDYYRRNRDFTIILSVLFYGLTITDALVDAHLAGFNITDDVALKINPTLITSPQSTTTAGLSFKLSIK